MAAALVLAGCADTSPPWHDVLVADSPCYRVDLSDGLDESDTTEVQTLFACANYHGHLRSLEPAAAHLEDSSPQGVPAGVELARAVNALPDAGADVDLVGTLSTLIGLVEDEALSDLGQDLALELVYGQSHVTVRRSDFDLQDASALQGGVLTPLAPVIPEVAAAMEDDPEGLELLADVLEDPETVRWARTVDGWVRSEHPDVQGPVGGMLPHLGEAIVATRSPANDRWSRASGDSARDLVDALAKDDLLDAISPDVAAVLGDAKARRDLPDLLVQLQADGHLQVTPRQATFLANVDTRGGSLDRGEDSALVALLRLLSSTNRPMQCRVDLFFTVIDVDLGNLAVTLLRVLADQDPDDVQSVAGIFGEALGGYGVGEGVLRNIADTGACPALTDQVVDDLYALERLGEPQTRGLTHTLIGAVRVLRDGDQDRVQELVDVITALDEAGALHPTEELVRDVGRGEIGADLVNLVAVMDAPERYGITAGDEPATTLEDLLEVITWVVEPGDDGRTGWQRARPLLTPALEHDGTWVALGRLGALLAGPQTASGQALDLIPALVDADPELSALTGAAPALRATTVTGPTLRLLQTRPLVDAVLATEPPAPTEDAPDPSPEVPQAFVGRLIVNGAVDDLLRTLRVVLADVEGS